ncbi:MAG: polynucleotide adenylyltransferase PcnB [Gammaproteobacteria bacterium]
MGLIFKYIKKLIPSAKNKAKPTGPVIYHRSDHNISRSQISENALKVLYRLKKSGYEAYLVGGCVRDLLLGREPKDFDVVTDAHPEQIRKVFRNCRLIGRRFRLAHVHFGKEIIEVATFRGTADGAPDDDRVHEDGRLLRDNVYGTIEEDVWRRDFTVNSLYYNIRDFSVVDFTGGMEDHKQGQLKLIGDARVRYREDPVRMLRAVRFAVKLGFKLHPDCEKPINEMAHLLNNIPSARLYDEMLKLFLSGYAVQTFELLRHYKLFSVLFPDTDTSLSVEDHGYPKMFLAKALENTDNRLAEGKPVTPYFLLAAFLWEPVQSLAAQKIAQGLNETIAYQEAGSEVIARQVKSTAFPRHVGIAMREVWNFQPRLHNRKGMRPFRLLGHPRFRAAYDFLALRAETGGADAELADWWKEFQEADDGRKKKMTQGSGKSARKRTGNRGYRQTGGKRLAS